MVKRKKEKKDVGALFVHIPQEMCDAIEEGSKEQKTTKTAFIRKIIFRGLKAEGFSVSDDLIEEKLDKLPIREKVEYVRQVLDLCHKVFGKNYCPSKWLLRNLSGLERYELNYLADKKFTNIRNSWEISIPFEHFRIISIRPPTTEKQRRQQFLDAVNIFLFFYDELHKIVEKFNPSHIKKLEDFFKENGKRIHDDLMRWYLFGMPRPLPEGHKRKAVLTGMTKRERTNHYKRKRKLERLKR